MTVAQYLIIQAIQIAVILLGIFLYRNRWRWRRHYKRGDMEYITERLNDMDMHICLMHDDLLKVGRKVKAPTGDKPKHPRTRKKP